MNNILAFLKLLNRKALPYLEKQRDFGEDIHEKQ